MQKLSIKSPLENSKKEKKINPNNIRNYLFSFFLKITSGVILIIIFFFQIEFLLIFIIQKITNNIYYTIIILIISHLLFIKFLIQSILYVMHCPILDSICFYSISCHQMQQLFQTSKDFISLYNKLNNKNKIIENKDFIFIDGIAHIINGYFHFFKAIKNSGKLTENQNVVYEKLEMWMKTFDDYHQYLDTFNNKNDNDIYNINNNNKEGELIEENKNNHIISFLRKMAIDSQEIKNILKNYLCHDQEFFSFKNFYNCFINKDFLNFEQLSILFHKRFNNKYKFFITSDNQIIDYTIISYNKLNEVYKNKVKKNIQNEIISKNLIIYCNPNGMIYQLFTPDKFISLLEGGCDILLWNYRGYGSSTGNPTFKNAKTDALELFDYAKKKYSKYTKYGVYGYSVGGGSAIYIANQRNVDVLICDRNFSCVGEILRDIYFFGGILYFLYKIINFKYDYNVSEFIKSKNNNICKIVLCDPEDEIIPDSASLKVGISKYIIKKYCEEQKNKIKEDILDLFLEDSLKSKFIDALFCLIGILKKFDENPFQDIIPTKTKKKNKKDKENLNESLLLNIGDNPIVNKKGFKNLLIKTIIKIFNSFKFSTENLENFKNKERNSAKILHINNYFNNFFVWGSISNEKLSESNGFTNPFSKSNNISYLNDAINTINEFSNDKKIKNFENDEDYKNIFENIYVIKKCLQIFINKSKIFDLEKKINIGSLIRLNCGHNGNFSEIDKQNLIDILKDIKFIY